MEICKTTNSSGTQGRFADGTCDSLSCRYRGRKGPGITMYNYGSPRVGNAAFARAYDESVPNSWRITNKLDVIPRVPRLMGYSHVGNSCSVLPDGTFEVNGELCNLPLFACSSSFNLACPHDPDCLSIFF